jgi:hypothetical protein
MSTNMKKILVVDDELKIVDKKIKCLHFQA